MSLRFRANSPTVIHDTIDGDTVVIHLGTGTYYNLEGVACVIWTALMGGANWEQLCSETAAAYGMERSVVDSVLRSFVEELEQEKLLVRMATEEEAVPRPTLGLVGGVFTPPVLQRYSDMQELIIQDPIHDVDPLLGWPATSTEKPV